MQPSIPLAIEDHLEPYRVRYSMKSGNATCISHAEVAMAALNALARSACSWEVTAAYRRVVLALEVSGYQWVARPI